jgi:hypothetical protein
MTDDEEERQHDDPLLRWGLSSAVRRKKPVHDSTRLLYSVWVYVKHRGRSMKTSYVSALLNRHTNGGEDGGMPCQCSPGLSSV